MPFEHQVGIIWSVLNGFLDAVPVADVRAWEEAFHTFMSSSGAKVLEEIREKKALDEDAEKALRKAVEEFSKSYAPSNKSH